VSSSLQTNSSSPSSPSSRATGFVPVNEAISPEVRTFGAMFIVFWIVAVVSSLVVGYISGILGGIVWLIMVLVGAALGLAIFVAAIISLIKAYQGQFFKLPVIGNYAEKFSTK